MHTPTRYPFHISTTTLTKVQLIPPLPPLHGAPPSTLCVYPCAKCWLHTGKHRIEVKETGDNENPAVLPVSFSYTRCTSCRMNCKSIKGHYRWHPECAPPSESIKPPPDETRGQASAGISETNLLLFGHKLKNLIARDTNQMHYTKKMLSTNVDNVCNVAQGWLSMCMEFVTQTVR